MSEQNKILALWRQYNGESVKDTLQANATKELRIRHHSDAPIIVTSSLQNKANICKKPRLGFKIRNKSDASSVGPAFKQIHGTDMRNKLENKPTIQKMKSGEALSNDKDSSVSNVVRCVTALDSVA